MSWLNKQPRPRQKTQKTNIPDLKYDQKVTELYKRNSLSEKERKEKRLGNFVVKDSKPFIEIKKKFGFMEKGKLVDLAFCVANELKIHFDRDAQRSTAICYRWFDENWKIIIEKKILDQIKFGGDQNTKTEANENKFDENAQLKLDAGAQLNKLDANDNKTDKVDFYDFMKTESDRYQENPFDSYKFITTGADDELDFK